MYATLYDLSFQDSDVLYVYPLLCPPLSLSLHTQLNIPSHPIPFHPIPTGPR